MQPSDMARALSRARTLIGEGTALKLQVFCEIASAPTGCIEQEALHNRVRAKRSTLSALLHDLSDVDHFKRPGPGYITIETDPSNLRFNIIRLSERGRAIADALFLDRSEGER